MYISTTRQGGRTKRGGEGQHQENATPQVQCDKRRAQGNGGAQERQDQDDLNH